MSDAHRHAGAPRHSGSSKLTKAFAAAGLVIGLGVGVVLGQALPSTYESTTQLLVGPIGADRSTLDAAGSLTRTYTDLLTSRTALERAAGTIDAQADDATLAVVADERSRTILLVVTSAEIDLSPSLARALVDDLMLAVNGPEGIDLPAESSDPGQVRVLDPPTDPAIERRSVPLFLLIGATMVGGAIGWMLGRLNSHIMALTLRSVDRQAADTLRLESRGIRLISARRSTRPAGVSVASPSTDKQRRIDVDDLALVEMLFECGREGPFKNILLSGVSGSSATVQIARRLVAAGKRIGDPVVVAAVDSSQDLEQFGVDDDVVDRDGDSDDSWMSRIVALTDNAPDDAVLMLVIPPDTDTRRTMAAAAVADRVVFVETDPGVTRRPAFDELVERLRSVGGRVVAVIETDLFDGGDQ